MKANPDPELSEPVTVLLPLDEVEFLDALAEALGHGQDRAAMVRRAIGYFRAACEARHEAGLAAGMIAGLVTAGAAGEEIEELGELGIGGEPVGPEFQGGALGNGEGGRPVGDAFLEGAGGRVEDVGEEIAAGVEEIVQPGGGEAGDVRSGDGL